MNTATAPAPRTTLVWGGAGVGVATLTPPLLEVVFLFPSALSSVLFPVLTTLGNVSACVLVVAFAILGFGLRGEPGIAGDSKAGRTALVTYAVLGVVTSAFLALPPPTAIGLPSVWVVVIWALAILRVGALIVATAIVFRAGVVHGVARWGLPVVAFAAVTSVLAQVIPLDAAEVTSVWSQISVPVALLLTGALYLVQGARTSRAALEAVPEA